MQVEKSKTSMMEKIFYGLGNAGGQCVWTFAGSFLTLYYTDSVLVSAGFIGTMMLLARLADGISDILFGILIEKTNTKWGKARPWYILSIIPLLISLFLAFYVPSGLTTNQMYVYIVVTYLLLTVVFYTIYNLGYWAMLPRISTDPDDRNIVSTVSSICGLLTGLVLAVVTAPFLTAMGGTTVQSAWTAVTVAFCVVGFVLLGLCAVFVKEKIPSDVQENTDIEKVSTKDGILSLLKCKYFYIALTIFTVGTLGSSVFMAAAPYYCKDVLGNPNYYSILALSYVLPMVLGLTMMPKFFTKYGKRKTMIVGGLIAIGGYAITFIDTTSIAFVAGGIAISSLARSSYMCAQWTFAADIVDYIERRIGIRVEGMASATNSFGAKVGTGVGSAILGWALEFGGYSALKSVQSPSTIFAEIFVMIGVPLIGIIINCIMATQWKIEEEN